MNDPPENDEQFSALERYLDQLQRGRRPDRESLLRDFPELKSALECLDALETMAPPPGTDASDGDETSGFSSSIGRMPRDFGSYELLEEIGRGGMGVVYKARQKDLDRIVAIKMILSSHLASQEHVRRFHVEAKAAAGLRHSNIVHIHEVGQLHGQHYFTMEYIEGTSLAERIAEAPVDVATAVRLVEQIARAVDHLHEHGVVHRDLKPSNILLDAEEQPYVTDFGLAKVFVAGSDETTTGTILGTASYMSPEQASGRHARVGPTSDVYSLGVLLYELLTGRPPFREGNPLDTLLQVLSREPTLPRQIDRGIPRSLELICLKCLAKSPEDRYPSARALADDLEHFLKDETLTVRPPNLGQRLWSWSRREPALAARLAVLGVFFVVENVNWVLNPAIDWSFHWKMLILMAVWTTTAVVFQKSLAVQRWSVPARFLWGTLDSVLLLAVLLIADGAASALVVCYPMLIVASGLWFRERFVWFITGLSVVSYGILVLDFYFRRPELQDGFVISYDWHVIFTVMLVGVGWGVAYLVHRVKVLSRYCGQRL